MAEALGGKDDESSSESEDELPAGTYNYNTTHELP